MPDFGTSSVGNAGPYVGKATDEQPWRRLMVSSEVEETHNPKETGNTHTSEQGECSETFNLANARGSEMVWSSEEGMAERKAADLAV